MGFEAGYAVSAALVVADVAKEITWPMPSDGPSHSPVGVLSSGDEGRPFGLHSLGHQWLLVPMARWLPITPAMTVPLTKKDAAYADQGGLEEHLPRHTGRRRRWTSREGRFACVMFWGSGSITPQTTSGHLDKFDARLVFVAPRRAFFELSPKRSAEARSQLGRTASSSGLSLARSSRSSTRFFTSGSA